MQKIKYPVGSKLKNDIEEGKIEEITSNGFACILNINNLKWHWFSQQELDNYGWRLISSPRWIPKKSETYWAINSLGLPEFNNWDGAEFDLFRLKNNNVFKTLEECQNKIDEINSREI